MQIGKLEIPEKRWAFVEQELSGASSQLEPVRKWYDYIPSYEILASKTPKDPLIKIYNYTATNIVVKGKAVVKEK